MNRFRFIDAERADYSVSLLCRVLRVSRSGYYAWKGRPPSKRSVEDAALTQRIREVHERSRRTYGYPRVHAELRASGVECGRRRVARLMRKAAIQGCMRGRRRRSTTRQAKDATAAPDLVDRRFLAASPDRLWLADITCLPTREGFLYLAFILDACSRRVVGWAMAAHLRAELVVDALSMALMRRDPVRGLIHHSDRGTQYTALSFGQRLEEAGIFPSMGRVGSALDNAMAEAFVASLKAEMEVQTGSRTFAHTEAARTAVFDYIEGFYNTRRIHSSIGNVSPADYERAISGEVRAA
ncbi:MAG: IS3 family transposase [Rubrobacter sp.]